MMREDAEVTIDGVADVLLITQIKLAEILADALERLVADVGTPGLDEGSEELHTFTDLPDMKFTHVQLQSQMIQEEPADLRHDAEQPVTVRADDIGVIDIATVVAGSEGALHELIKLIEIDIREELGCEVTYRKSTAFRCKEE